MLRQQSARFKTSGVYPLNGYLVIVKPLFTTEKEELFQKCFAEGRDIYTDDDYFWWLHINHPVGISLSDYFPSFVIRETRNILDFDSSIHHTTSKMPQAYVPVVQ